MRRPEFIASQSRCATRLLGRLIGRIMAAETAAENAELLALLELRPTDHVLEVGFDHGRTIERAASQVLQGFVAGVDCSEEEMVRMATRRTRQLI